MPETINWTVSLQVPGGPRLGQSDALAVEAYDKISVTLEAGASDVDVEVQPSSTAGQVSLLALMASAYAPELTFSADGGSTTRPLVAPVCLIGAGAVSLLDATPQQLQLANRTDDPVTVDIVVGRDATPPPP